MLYRIGSTALVCISLTFCKFCCLKTAYITSLELRRVKETKQEDKKVAETNREETERRQRQTECEVICHTGWSVSHDKWIHYNHSRHRATHWTISVTHQREKSLHGSRVGMEQSDLLSVQMAYKLCSSMFQQSST